MPEECTAPVPSHPDLGHDGVIEATRGGAKVVGIAGALAAVAMLAVAFAPLQRSTSMVMDSQGRSETTSGSRSLLASEGASIFVVAAIPVLVALAPLLGSWLGKPRLFRAMLVGSTAFVGLFVLVTGFSIGLLYVPALVALVAATARSSSGDAEHG